VERVARDYPAAGWQSWELLPIPLSADVLRVNVLYVGADVARSHDVSAVSSWGPLGDGHLEVCLGSHAGSKVREK